MIRLTFSINMQSPRSIKTICPLILRALSRSEQALRGSALITGPVTLNN